AALRQRLERRLEEARKNEERLKAALDRLAKGEPPAEIMRELDLPGRAGRPDGPPRRGPGGPEGPRRPDPPRPDAEPGPGPRGEGPGDELPPLRPGQPIPPEVRQRAIEFVQENMPEVARRLEAIRDIDPGAGDRLIARFLPKIRDAMAA